MMRFCLKKTKQNVHMFFRFIDLSHKDNPLTYGLHLRELDLYSPLGSNWSRAYMHLNITCMHAFRRLFFPPLCPSSYPLWRMRRQGVLTLPFSIRRPSFAPICRIDATKLTGDHKARGHRQTMSAGHRPWKYFSLELHVDS